VRDGELTEASASNVFIVKNGTVLTPPKSHLILPGITYDVVLEILRANAIAHEVRPVAESELRSAEEIWVTSSSREVLPITTLDGKPVGRGEKAGKPGPVGERVYALYQHTRPGDARPGSCLNTTPRSSRFPCEFPSRSWKDAGRVRAGGDRGRQAARARFRPATLEMRRAARASTFRSPAPSRRCRAKQLDELYGNCAIIRW